MITGRRKFKITHHKDVTQARIKSASTEDSGVYRIKVVSSADYAIGHIVLNGNSFLDQISNLWQFEMSISLNFTKYRLYNLMKI